MSPSPSTPTASGLQNLINQAIDDLAQRLSIPITQIYIVAASPVVWPNSSLGCPQPGMFYTQALTNGYLIQLQAGDRIYQYHTNKNTYVFFCENPSLPVPGMPGDN